MEPTNATPEVPASVKLGGRELTEEQATNMVRRSSRWFYWIAGLSAINWLATAFHLDYSLIIGLGITQLITGFAIAAGEGSDGLRLVLMLFSATATFGAAGAFVFLGYHARKARLWAQIAGMVLYGLDALLFLWIQDWIAVGFHAFVIVMLWAGLSTTLAIRKARARDSSLGSLLRD